MSTNSKNVFDVAFDFEQRNIVQKLMFKPRLRLTYVEKSRKKTQKNPDGIIVADLVKLEVESELDFGSVEREVD